jgi:5-formyltetrahydrofolate cyclo-ligase
MLKSEIRKTFKERRKFVAPFELNRISEVCTKIVLERFDFSGKIVSVFLPIEKQKDINTYELVEEIMMRGGTIALSKSNFDNHSLVHYKYEKTSQLEVNSYGIPEPKFGEEIHEVMLDFVFVPLLAINNQGHRVGYGKGFYDKLLSKCKPNCVFIGLNIFDEFVIIDDIDTKLDVALHYCVTPNGFYDFR